MKTMIYFIAVLMLTTITISSEIKNEIETEETKAETRGKIFLQ